MSRAWSGRLLIALVCLSLVACGGGGSSSSSGFTLNVDNGTYGTVSVEADGTTQTCNPGYSCSFSFKPGTEVSLSVRAQLRYRLRNWSGDCSGNSNCLLTMSQNRSVGVHYEHLSSADIACLENNPPPTIPDISWQPLVSGLNHPLEVTNAGDNSQRLFVAEQGGTVRTVSNGTLDSNPFLDISDRVYQTGSRLEDMGGLMSLAFHPQFDTNHLFYVYYLSQRPALMTGGKCSNTNDLCLLISEFNADQVSANGTPTAGAERILLEIPAGAQRHGGHLAFGAETDPKLYISVSDTNSYSLPFDTASLAGKFLRIDVDAQDHGKQYAIPTDNPIQLAHSDTNRIDLASSSREIWAYGMRNPWRFSIDPLNGNIYVGDNGEYAEEINLINQSLFYGWSACEGDNTAGGLGSVPCVDFDGSGNPDGTSAYQTQPIYYFFGPPSGMGANDSELVAGPTYRGSLYGNLCGTTLFANFFNGDVTGFRYSTTSSSITEEKSLTPLTGIVSFGEDELLEVYAVSYSSNTLYKLISL